LGYGHPSALLPPPVIGNIGDPEDLDDIPHLLALADQDVRLAQFGNDLFGTITLLRYAGLLLESV
jgi:hypothetical protein